MHDFIPISLLVQAYTFEKCIVRGVFEQETAVVESGHFFGIQTL